jgi:putative hydrolase of the HAD superfamily
VVPPTVLWDFDGTLAFRDGMWVGCLLDVLDEHDPGHGRCADDFRQSLRDGFPWHTPQRPHPELTSADAWWAPVQELMAAAYRTAGYDGTRAATLAAHARTTFCDPTRSWRLFDDTLPALHMLRHEGWRHVILSNHVPELPAIVEYLRLGSLVDAIVNSAETGYEKPHLEAFAIARRVAGDPEILWMVGDNPVADVAGAEAAGIPAVLVRRDGAPTLAEAAARISQSRTDARFSI